MARDRPSPYAEGGRFSTQKPSRYRSAGALGCHTRIRAGFPRERPVDLSMARDRPSPYAEGGRFSTQKPHVTGARGSVPRERWAPFCRARAPDLDPFGSRCSRTTVFYRVRAWRGTGPRPTRKGAVFRLRNPHVTVARGPVPRDVERYRKHPQLNISNQ